MVRCNDIPEKICRYCGKKFPPAPQHSLKDTYGYYCKPTCFLHRDELKKRKARRVIAMCGDRVETFKSATDAANQFGTSQKIIRNACRNGEKYRGKLWKYEE